MNKPMYCPMSLANSEAAVGYFNAPTEFKPMECNPDCAWAFIRDTEDEYCCGIALSSFVKADGVDLKLLINWRPIDGDAE